MVNPGAFRGLRKDFLIGEKAAYGEGVRGGYAAEALANTQRRFFKRFPLDLPLDVEPTKEYLELVKDDEPDPEEEPPSKDELTPEEFAAAIARLEERQQLITFRKAQIKRWLAYQYMKDNDLDPNESGARNPYRLLLQKLTGTRASRPRLKTPANIWRKTHREQIEAEVQQQAIAGQIPKKKWASLREKIASQTFANLGNEEKEQWAQLAKDEHESAVELYEKELINPPSKKPEDLQRCIQGLTQFMQPILDAVCEATGWKATLITGGPEPAHEGRLNILSIHSGTTKGDVKMNFGRSEREQYKKFIVPTYSNFLRKCYTLKDCHAVALSPTEGFEAMTDMDWEGAGCNIDTVSTAPSSGLSHTTTVAVPNQTSSPTDRNVDTVSSALPTEGFEAMTDMDWEGAGCNIDMVSPVTTAPSGSSSALSHTTPVAIPNQTSSPTDRNVDTVSSFTTGSLLPITTVAENVPNQTSDSTDFNVDMVSPLPDTTEPSGSSVCGLSPAENVPNRPLPNCQTSSLDSPSLVVDFSRNRNQTPEPSPERQLSPTGLNSPTSTADCPRNRSPMPCPSLSHEVSPFPHTLPVQLPAPSSDCFPTLLPTHPNEIPLKSPMAISRNCTSTPPPPPPTTLVPLAHMSPILQSSAQVKNVRKRLLSKVGDQTIESSEQSRPLSKRARRSSALPLPAPPSKGRKNKESRKSTTTVSNAEAMLASAAPIAIPADCPAWFSKSMGLFQSEALGKEWEDLLGHWAAFESHEHYEEKARISSKGRPDVVEMWISRGRSVTWRPSITNVKQLEKEFNAWWTSLQPTWRLSRGVLNMARVDGEWDSLCRPGLNGIQSVIVVLFYWGTHVKTKPTQHGCWLTAVQDCLLAISRLS